MLVARNDQLSDLLGSAHTPDSSILLVGRPGSGRTRLLHEVERLSPVRAVSINPNRAERNTPLSGLSLLLNGLGNSRVAEFVGRFALVDETIEGAIAAAQDLLSVLRSMRLDPVVIIVDDIDLLDEQSQAVVAFMASRMTGTGVRLIASANVQDTGSILHGIRTVELPALDRSAAVELALRAHPRADPQTLRIVADSAGGLPGIILRTLETLSPDQLSGIAALSLPLQPLEGPARIHQGFDDETLAILRIVSTAPLHSVGAVLETAHVDRSQLEQLVALGLLDLSGGFVALRDTSLRSELYWRMTLAERGELHCTSASNEQGGPLAAWHIDHVGGSPTAPTELLRSARTLLREGFVHASIEYGERALMMTLDPEPHLDALMDYCITLVDAGEFGLAERYLSRCKQSASKDTHVLRSTLIDVTARALAESRIDENEIDIYVNRLAAQRPEDCAELLDTAAVFLAEEGEISAARHKVDLADRLAAHTNPGPLDLRHWAPRLIDALDGEGHEREARFTPDIIDLERLPIASLMACGHALSLEEDYNRARHAFTVLAMSLPAQRLHSAWLGPSLTLLAENERRAGQFHDASIAIDRLEAYGAPHNFRALLLLIWRSFLRNDVDAAGPYLDEARHRLKRAHHEIALAQLAALEGSFALMRGELEDAVLKLGHAFMSAPSLRPGVLRVEYDFIEALHLSGDRTAARRAVEAFAARHERRPSNWSRAALARARAITADDDAVISSFERALTSTMTASSTFDVARTRLGYAMALGRLGQRTRALEEQRAANFLFDSSSAVGWIRMVPDETFDLQGAQVNSLLSTLTDDELAVLRLIRRGVRNKDIASSLFVSLRTVEVRITQIYRKLEARSRSHLLALLPADIDLLEPH